MGIIINWWPVMPWHTEWWAAMPWQSMHGILTDVTTVIW